MNVGLIAQCQDDVIPSTAHPNAGFFPVANALSSWLSVVSACPDYVLVAWNWFWTSKLSAGAAPDSKHGLYQGHDKEE